MLFASSSHHADPTGLVIMVAFLAVFLAIGIVQRSRRMNALRAAAVELGADVLEVSGHHLKGRARGFDFTVQLQQGGKNTPSRTFVDVRTTPFDLLLALTLERTRGKRRGGAYVDVQIGDPGFDGAWVVEGAPEDRVKRLLADASLRRKLVSFSAHANASADLEDGVVHLAKDRLDLGVTMPSLDTVTLALDLAAAVTAENALASPNAPEREGDYRAAPSLADDRSGDRAAVVRLKKERAAREAGQQRVILLLVPVLATFPLMAFIGLTQAKPLPLMAYLPMIALVFPIFAMRQLVSSYFAKRRMAGLGPDVLLFVILGVSLAGALVWAAVQSGAL